MTTNLNNGIRPPAEGLGEQADASQLRPMLVETSRDSSNEHVKGPKSQALAVLLFEIAFDLTNKGLSQSLPPTDRPTTSPRSFS